MGLGNSLGLGITIKADDQASSAMKSVGAGLDHVATSAKHAHTNVVSINESLRYMQEAGTKIREFGTGMFHSFKSAADLTGSFDRQIVKVQNISMASADQLKLLRKAAIDAGIATQFTPLEAAQGLEQLASQGFNAKDSIQALLPALDLAAGGSIGVEQATAAMTSAVKVFGLDVQDASLAADKMLKIANATALSAKDLELAMGTVGRGASITKQSLDEMLPSIGLVKNTGVDASVAASSVSSALVHMGMAGKEFKKIGVSVTDAKGQFRPFMDVVLETESILSKKFPNAAEKVAHAEKLFSRFGLTAYSAITQQLGKGITDAEGKLYRGAAGVAFLRNEMATAAGTAKQFRDRMLDTYEGQKILWKGSVETAKIMFGEGFAAQFKPVVTFALTWLNRLIEVMQKIPEPVKKAFATVATITAGFIAAAGATVALVMGLKLASIAFAATGLTLGSFLTPFLIFAGALGLVATVIGVLSYGRGKNIGGLGDMFTIMVGKVKLAGAAISQLFGQGGFSGQVLKDLDRTENQGVKRFAVAVWSNVLKTRNFFLSMWDAMKAAWAQMEPAFRGLGQALWNFGAALGFVDKNDPSKQTTSWENWAKAGAALGTAIARVSEFLIVNLTRALEVAAPAVQLLKDLFASMSKDMESMGSEWAKLRREFSEAGKVTRTQSDDVGDWIDKWLTLGNVAKLACNLIGMAVNGLKQPFRMFGGWIASGIGSFATLYSAFQNVCDGIGDLLHGVFTGSWQEAWQGVKRIAFSAINAIMQMSLGLIQMFAKMLDFFVERADWIGEKLGWGKIGTKMLGPKPSDLVRDLRLSAQAGLYKAMGLEEPEQRPGATLAEKEGGGLTPLEQMASMGKPFAAPMYLRDETARKELEAEVARSRGQMGAPGVEAAQAGVPVSDFRTELEKTLAEQEFNVTVNTFVDGDRVEQATYKAKRNREIGEFSGSPQPEY